MPYFQDNPLEKLVFQPDDADAELDLQGLDVAEALQRVEDLLNTQKTDRSFLIRFDAARADGRETLFQPLGRRLLQARRDGKLSRCLPVADGAAYFIAFAKGR